MTIISLIIINKGREDFLSLWRGAEELYRIFNLKLTLPLANFLPGLTLPIFWFLETVLICLFVCLFYKKGDKPK